MKTQNTDKPKAGVGQNSTECEHATKLSGQCVKCGEYIDTDKAGAVTGGGTALRSNHPGGQTAHTLSGGKVIYLPNGLRVVPANNLPVDSEIKYWISELPKGYECDVEIESHFRNYGFGLRADEVK